jgi:hypothetical protein
MSVTLKSYANVGRIVSIAQVLLGSPQEASINPFAQLSCRVANGRVQRGAGASWWVSAMWRREAEAPGIGAINVIGISCILCDRADRIGPTSEFWPWIQASTG